MGKEPVLSLVYSRNVVDTPAPQGYLGHQASFNESYTAKIDGGALRLLEGLVTIGYGTLPFSGCSKDEAMGTEGCEYEYYYILADPSRPGKFYDMTVKSVVRRVGNPDGATYEFIVDVYLEPISEEELREMVEREQVNLAEQAEPALVTLYKELYGSDPHEVGTADLYHLSMVDLSERSVTSHIRKAFNEARQLIKHLASLQARNQQHTVKIEKLLNWAHTG